MEWAEFPQRDRLKVYGERVRGLRDRVRQEDAAGKPGPAHEELRVVLTKLGPWFHNVPLTRTIGTRPELPEHPANRWSAIDPFVPRDLTGKTVLDIGVNAGFFSLELKRRGAARVIGIDIIPFILAQTRFTSHWFELPIELLEWDVYDVDSLGTFDVVVFLGVLYHLKHPLYALEKIEKACSGTFYFQSVVRGCLGDFEPEEDYPISETAVFDRPEYPKLYFIEKSFNADASNWWMATRAARPCSGWPDSRTSRTPRTTKFSSAENRASRVPVEADSQSTEPSRTGFPRSRARIPAISMAFGSFRPGFADDRQRPFTRNGGIQVLPGGNGHVRQRDIPGRVRCV